MPSDQIRGWVPVRGEKTRQKGFVRLALAFFLPRLAVPVIRCERFQPCRRTRCMVRRNSSAGRARHS